MPAIRQHYSNKNATLAKKSRPGKQSLEYLTRHYHLFKFHFHFCYKNKQLRNIIEQFFRCFICYVKRLWGFLRSCSSSGNDVINFVCTIAKYRMSSCAGRNIQFGCERYHLLCMTNDEWRRRPYFVLSRLMILSVSTVLKPTDDISL